MLASVIHQFEVYLFSKDSKGKFLFCNDKFAEAAGLDSAEQILGKTDHDLVWRHQASIFQAGDQKVLQGETFVNIHEVMLQSKKISDILVCKSQLLNKSNKCTGVIGSFIDITGHCLQKKTGFYDVKTGRFNLGEAFDNAFLSPKQFLVFKYILMGYTSKRIAECLNLARRTTENYIDAVKNKLQCTSKGEIIKVAIYAGLMHVVNVD